MLKKLRNENKLEQRLTLLSSSQEQGSTVVTPITSLCKPSLKIQNLYAGLGSEEGAFDIMIEKDGHSEPVMRILKAYCVYDVRVGYHPHLASLVESILRTNVSAVLKKMCLPMTAPLSNLKPIFLTDC